jgi:hypothetical protein
MTKYNKVYVVACTFCKLSFCENHDLTKHLCIRLTFQR